MRIGQVIGKVVLSRVHPSLVGAQFKIVLPLTFKDLVEATPKDAEPSNVGEAADNGDESTVKAINRLVDCEFPRKWGNELVVYDDCSSALGEWLAFSEGAEAAAAFGKEQRPVDAFGAAILDSVVIDGPVVDALMSDKD